MSYLKIQVCKMYEIKTTTKFEKDLKLMKKRGYDLKLLKEVIDILSNGEELSSKYKDHYLQGDYIGFKECHIKPDWLLVYKIDNNILVLTLSRTGKHSDLFQIYNDKKEVQKWLPF